jgi:precorrin-2 dehydrogenase / sirohydrochlorin ferrochelatase
VTFAFPVFLGLVDVPVLVVGGGPIGRRKALGLVAAGARVTVVAPDIVEGLADEVAEVRQRPYIPSDLDGHRLAITATGIVEVDAAVSADAQARGMQVNSADDPQRCTFILPAVARRGRVSIAVSTDGTAPALASWLRDRIAEYVDSIADIGAVAADLQAQRDDLHRNGVSTEDIDWRPRIAEAIASAGPRRVEY